MTGDLDFANLVDLHYGPLYRFALSLTQTESDACDLVQETFHVWAAKGHQLQDPSKAKTWLFTTLNRQFLGAQRRLARFPHLELEQAAPELPMVPPESLNCLDGEAALTLLAQVDEQYQAPIALFYLEDISYNEIAEILAVPLGTVKSRIARGLIQLRQLVAKKPTIPNAKSEVRSPIKHRMARSAKNDPDSPKKNLPGANRLWRIRAWGLLVNPRAYLKNSNSHVASEPRLKSKNFSRDDPGNIRARSFRLLLLKPARRLWLGVSTLLNQA